MSARRLVVAATLAALSACGPPSPPTSSIHEVFGGRTTSASPLRPDQPGNELGDPAFDATETVESWVSPAGRIRVHYSRAGRNAVPVVDRDMTGVPDYVELTGATYDAVRATYHGELQLLEPVSDSLLGAANGGDDLFDVYLVDFAGRGDGAYRKEACLVDRRSECTGFMLQENDFVGYRYPSLTIATRILASHEYFHAVQNAYDGDQDTIFAESTAVWATERFDPSLSDFEGFIDAYLSRTDRSIDTVSGGVVDAKSYGTAIFFQFLSEYFREDRAVLGLLDEVKDGAHGVADPQWFGRLGPFLSENYRTTYAETFRTFATWNVLTGARADPSRGYARGAAYPSPAAETAALPFRLEAPRFFTSSVRYFRAPPEGRASIAAALVVPDDRLAELEPLALYLARVEGEAVSTPVRIADVRAGVESIEVAGAGEILAWVVNTAQEGQSVRPDLCLGAPDEVAACIARVPDAGAGEADAGVPVDAGVEEPRAPDGGCTDMGGPRPARSCLAVSLVFAALLGLRRSR